MLKSYLRLLIDKQFLTKKEAQEAMTIILEEADPYQTAAFLAILSYRGETPVEVAGMVAAMQKKMVPVRLPFPVLDVVGTGGDLANTVNISTGSAILAAACGIPVAKHGNRSISSQSGSADVLEELGIELNLSLDHLHDCIKEVGIGFMFAGLYHPALRSLSVVRRGIKLPTVLNILGPLLNPAKAEYAVIGVANESVLELMSRVILELGTTKRTLLFHGSGLDELTPLGSTIAYDIRDGQMHRFEIDPYALGFSPCTLKDLQGGDARVNAAVLQEIFSGKRNPVADSLILNAGAGLWIFGKTDTLCDGVETARQVLYNGKASELLEKWRKFSNSVKGNEVSV